MMVRQRIPVLISLFLSAAFLVACTGPKSPPQQGLQEAAVARWSRCIERFNEQYQGSLRHIQQQAQVFCEGHQRDIFAVYPPHLKNQIESLLSQRANTLTTVHLIKTGGEHSLSADKGAELDTLRLRLMGTR